MKYLKLLSIGVLIMSKMAMAGSMDLKGTYGLHLFFNETEYVDVLTLDNDERGTITGHMFVPNDFEGDIENIIQAGNTLQFDLFVPKNAGRPQDLIFTYKLTFHGNQHDQFIGFVTLKDQTDFIASFVGFKR